MIGLAIFFGFLFMAISALLMIALKNLVSLYMHETGQDADEFWNRYVEHAKFRIKNRFNND